MAKNFSIFAMIEEAFSCNIVKSKGKQQASTENNSLMDLLIPFIWSHKLSQANQYGVPHNNVEHIYKGPFVVSGILLKKQPEKIEEKNGDDYQKEYDQYKEDMKTAEKAFIDRIKEFLKGLENKQTF